MSLVNYIVQEIKKCRKNRDLKSSLKYDSIKIDEMVIMVWNSIFQNHVIISHFFCFETSKTSSSIFLLSHLFLSCLVKCIEFPCAETLTSTAYYFPVMLNYVKVYLPVWVENFWDYIPLFEKVFNGILCVNFSKISCFYCLNHKCIKIPFPLNLTVYD